MEGSEKIKLWQINRNEYHIEDYQEVMVRMIRQYVTNSVSE